MNESREVGRYVVLAAFAAFASAIAVLAEPAAAQNAGPSADQAAYILGVNLGAQLHQDGVTNELSIKRLVDGVRAGLGGKTASPDEARQLQAFLREAREAATARNAAAARAFLARNAQKPDVTTTASGLQYTILAPGDPGGASPQPTDLVTVRYRATLLDGSEFDSSARHANSAPLPLNNTIKAWQEALALMKPGAKWRLFVPPDLAYGMGTRPNLPGGSLLIYEIELTTVARSPRPMAQATPAAALARSPQLQ
jgi:FKBP-type peptidyl-prolyl cis-trans isomerase